MLTRENFLSELQAFAKKEGIEWNPHRICERAVNIFFVDPPDGSSSCLALRTLLPYPAAMLFFECGYQPRESASNYLSADQITWGYEYRRKVPSCPHRYDCCKIFNRKRKKCGYIVVDIATSKEYSPSWGSFHLQKILASNLPQENVVWGLSEYFANNSSLAKDHYRFYFKTVNTNIPAEDMLLIAKYIHIYQGIPLAEAVKKLISLTADEINEINEIRKTIAFIQKGNNYKSHFFYHYGLNKAEGIAMLQHFPKGYIYADINYYNSRPYFYVKSPWYDVDAKSVPSFVKKAAKVFGCSEVMAIKKLCTIDKEQFKIMQVAMQFI